MDQRAQNDHYWTEAQLASQARAGKVSLIRTVQDYHTQVVHTPKIELIDMYS
jgi:hypothetical protein